MFACWVRNFANLLDKVLNHLKRWKGSIDFVIEMVAILVLDINFIYINLFQWNNLLCTEVS